MITRRTFLCQYPLHDCLRFLHQENIYLAWRIPNSCFGFIHLGSRKVYPSYPTSYPPRDWIIQECRNVSMWLEDEGLDCKYILLDREVVYPEDSMKAFFKSDEIKIIKTPVRAPKANAY